jgi:hypothetical protein
MHPDGSIRKSPVTVLLLAGLATAFAVSLAAPTARAAADAPTSAAVIVHLSGGPSPSLPATAGEMRRASLDLSAALLYAQDVMVVDRAQTESLVQRHVVRTGQSFGPAFLADVAGGTGAAVLVAVSLEVEGSHLATSVRAIATSDGSLLGIGLAEAEVGPAGWQKALSTTLRDAMPGLANAGTGPVLVILPARAVGTDPRAARAATSSLLATALADGRWRPLDPALVAGAVAEAGCNLERLDSKARAVLMERCGVSWAVVPEIVSFDATARTQPSPEFLENAGARQASLSEFTFSLRLLDLRSGLVLGTSSTHLPGGTVHGWFGLVKNLTTLQRIRTAADEAWSRFHGFLQEKAS